MNDLSCHLWAENGLHRRASEVPSLGWEWSASQGFQGAVFGLGMACIAGLSGWLSWSVVWSNERDDVESAFVM